MGPLQHQSSSLSALAQRCLRSIASSTPQVSATEQTQWPKTKAAVGNGRGGLPIAPAGVATAVALLLREGGGYLLQARYLSVRGQLIDKFREVLR